MEVRKLKFSNREKKREYYLMKRTMRRKSIEVLNWSIFHFNSIQSFIFHLLDDLSRNQRQREREREREKKKAEN
jgi:hypothetical protein